MFLSVAAENVTLVKMKPTDSDYSPDCTGKSKLTDPDSEAFKTVDGVEKQEQKSPVLAVLKKVDKKKKPNSDMHLVVFLQRCCVKSQFNIQSETVTTMSQPCLLSRIWIFFSLLDLGDGLVCDMCFQCHTVCFSSHHCIGETKWSVYRNNGWVYITTHSFPRTKEKKQSKAWIWLPFCFLSLSWYFHTPLLFHGL